MNTVLDKPTPVAPEANGVVSDDPRAVALASLQKKREFRTHLLAYVLVNSFLWLVWGVVYAAGGTSFPWPVFPMAGWGVGLALHGWDTYRSRPFTDDEIRREITRLSESRLR